MRIPTFILHLTLLATVTLASSAVPAFAGVEPALPTTMQITEQDITHQLDLTGTAERSFLFFHVYDIAHYAESAGPVPFSPDAVIEDGPAKALRITFARKLGVERIRDEFAKTLRRNARPQWLADAEQTIAAFIAAIDRDTRAGDQFALYWLAGGRVRAEFNGERAFAATDTAFAKLLWSIWFGADPVCDREQLLARWPRAMAL